MVPTKLTLRRNIMEIVVVIESLAPTLNGTGCVERYDAIP